MNDPTIKAPQTEDTQSQSELDEEALEAVSGGAAFIKFDGVDGESRKKKGNVEYTWKVEEGVK